MKLPISRAGLQEVVVSAFHIHNTYATSKMGRNHFALKRYFQAVIDYQVDIISGDANQAAFKYYNNQEIPDPGNSVVQLLFHQMIADVNRGVELKCRVSGLLLDNNSVNEYVSLSRGEPDVDLDCCFTGILHWGHNEDALVARRALPANEIPADLLFGPIDFSVNMSDRIRQLKASHLWLRPRDTDWHRPIVVTLHEILQKNWRKKDAGSRRGETRKEEGIARQKKG